MAAPARPLVDVIRECRAFGAVGPSTARSQPTGTVDGAREALKELDLRRFSTRNPAVFVRELDRATDDVLARLREETRRSPKWGFARKFINIYLRDAFYNRYLYKAFELHGIEKCLEVPLDNIVAKCLMRERAASELELPRRFSISKLTPKDSRLFQEAARLAARDHRLPARVHLDMLYWPRDRWAASKRSGRRRSGGSHETVS